MSMKNKDISGTPKYVDGHGVNFGILYSSSEMKGELAERIKICAKMAGSGDLLAQKAAIPRRTLETYISGKSEPKALKAAQIAWAAHVDLTWLITGKGPMQPADTLDTASGAIGGDFALITVYDVRASAGYGASIDQEQPLSEIAFRRDWLRQEGLNINGLAALTADGDSMEPTIKGSSLLLVDTHQRDLAGNRIYVLRMDGHLYAKRLQQLTDGSIRVSSDNSAYADEVIDKEDMGNLDIIGRVVWVGCRV